MTEITFSKEEKEIISKRVQRYFNDELDQEIGQFDALFLIDFFAKEMGGYFYNRGLYDAQAILERRLEELSETIYELEKVTEFRR
ncbi:MAG: DUF2164 domain-containing protein [Candidatus Polarisedimenticolaceae bacterium]|nr:DUF2164 domain-containing protein [Candidatus Polarisedimenticolaceae bacterium]